MEHPPIAVVVVNLDGETMLDDCLASIAAQGNVDTIVVDNGSATPEVARLALLASIHLVRLTRNSGFAEPSNRGVKEATREGRRPRFVAFVNNDCVLEQGYLSACARVLDADERLAAVQGVLLDASGLIVDGCGIGWNDWAEAVQLRRGGSAPAAEAPAFEVPGVSATAAVYRLAAFEAVNGFEESFFAYYEDADLSLRLARRSWTFACVPAARARHLGSMTGRRTPALRWRRVFENRLRTLRRNFAPDAAARLLRHGPVVPSALRGAAREIGWGRAVLAAVQGTFGSRRARRADNEALVSAPPLLKLPG